MLIVLNNKSNFLYNQFTLYKENLNSINSDSTIILCPSGCYLSSCDKTENFFLGAQDVSSSESGVITGNISAKQLSSLNVKYCIVGHSDIGDNDEIVKNKIVNLLKNNITPILCVSDSGKLSSLSKKKEDVLEKIGIVSSYVASEDFEKIILVYEPFWAVNNDIFLEVADISFIINSIKDNYSSNKVLYGGGININNISDILGIKMIDGVLLGRFGNDVDNFKDLL